MSWLVNLFWQEFAATDSSGTMVKRPPHSYVNIDRSPWFRKVGINVSDDGRQKENGELANYSDFLRNINNLTPRHLAELRVLYIHGGIEEENVESIINEKTILDGKRVLIVDEVSRTGSTLNIATKLFELAFPKAKEIRGSYFWHPSEPPLKMGNENILTSLPVWYDPDTLTGRGIGGLDEKYYRNRFERYSEIAKSNSNINLSKLRAQAFAAPVFSAPLLNIDGSIFDLADEKKTRELYRDLRKLYDTYKAGRLFFAPPLQWMDFNRFEDCIKAQGLKTIPENASAADRDRIRKDPLFYLNFLNRLRNT